jgi:hypothetical protein
MREVVLLRRLARRTGLPRLRLLGLRLLVALALGLLRASPLRAAGDLRLLLLRARGALRLLRPELVALGRRLPGPKVFGLLRRPIGRTRLTVRGTGRPGLSRRRSRGGTSLGPVGSAGPAIGHVRIVSRHVLVGCRRPFIGSRCLTIIRLARLIAGSLVRVPRVLDGPLVRRGSIRRPPGRLRTLLGLRLSASRFARVGARSGGLTLGLLFCRRLRGAPLVGGLGGVPAGRLALVVLRRLGVRILRFAVAILGLGLRRLSRISRGLAGSSLIGRRLAHLALALVPGPGSLVVRSL